MWTNIPNEDWTPAMPPTYCYVDTYLSTQDRLLTMDIDTLVSAHWPTQRGPDVKAFIQESKNYCLHVEQKLLDYARAGNRFTLCEAIDTLGLSLGEWAEGANQDFSYGMLGNLNHLTKRGLLTTGRNDAGLVVWSASS